MVSAVQREPEPRAKPLATEPLLKPAKEEPRECLPNNADAGNFCAELPLSRDANNSLRRMLMLQSSTIFRAVHAQSAVGATGDAAIRPRSSGAVHAQSAVGATGDVEIVHD